MELRTITEANYREMIRALEEKAANKKAQNVTTQKFADGSAIRTSRNGQFEITTGTTGE